MHCSTNVKYIYIYIFFFFKLCSHWFNYLNKFFLSFLLFPSLSVILPVALSLLKLPHFLSSASLNLCWSAAQPPQTHLADSLPNRQPSSNPPLAPTHLTNLPSSDPSCRSVTESTGTFTQLCPFVPFSQFAFGSLCVCVFLYGTKSMDCLCFLHL